MAQADATNATLSGHARARKPRRGWQAQFLEGFAQQGTVKGACAHAGIHRATAYRERQRNEAFAVEWADLEDELTDTLEACAVELALSGEHPRTLEFLLKARKPNVYRERHQVEVAGPDGGPVQIDALGIDLSKLSERDLRDLQRIVSRAER